jgi:tetratricopeptide (TPR) repeat protein
MRARALIPLLWAFALPVHAAEGPFRPLSFAQGLAAAREERKPLLVELTAEWCSSCKELDLKTLSRGSVQRFLRERFVAIRVDGEKGEGPELMRRYHVVGFPTLLVIDARGREIDRIFDVLGAEQFVVSLEGYLHGSGTIADLERRLTGRLGDLRLKAQLGERLAIRGERERAAILLAEVVMADHHNLLGLASSALLTLGKYLFLRGQNDPGTARRCLEALLAAFPTSKQTGEALAALAAAHARLGDWTRALSLLQEPIARAPKKGGGYNTLAWFYYREKKDLSAALTATRGGLAEDPGDDALWDSHAEFLGLAGRYAEARAAAERALALKPADPYYRYQVARFDARAKGAK